MINIITKDYSEKTPFLLFPDEKLIFKTNPSWLLLAWPVGILLAVWLIYIVFLCAFVAIITFKGLCFILSMLAFPFAIFIFYLDWRCNRLYFTNFRFVKQRGIIGQRFMSIFLEQVEDITVNYGFWGRLFDFGNIEIESAGTYGRMVFQGAPHPMTKKWLIENRIANSKSKF
jgi:hypothetical protein